MIIFRIISTIFSQIKIMTKNITSFFYFMVLIILAIYKKLINITFQQMSLIEDSGPSLTQKSISQQKQTNSIRKITIQSLSPIISKLQQHITYLLDQTSNLRSQNANLLAVMAKQKAFQIIQEEMGINIEKISNKMNALNRQKDNKLKEKETQIKMLTEKVEKINKDLQVQSKFIHQIDKRNDEYISRINQSKQDQLQSISDLKSSIQNYYQQQLIKVEGLKDQFQSLKASIASLQQYRKIDQQQLSSVLKVTSLYDYQRKEYQKMIEKAAFLENNVVMITDYEKDKKYQKIDNQQTKKDIKIMLDDALTPEIRLFLPKLIIKLGQLERFQSTLSKMNAEMLAARQKQDERVTVIQQKWQKTHNNQAKINQQSFKALREAVSTNYETLDDKILILQQKCFQRLKQSQEDLKQFKVSSTYRLQQSLSKLQADLKQYLQGWGDKFLDKKKDNIYNLVQTQKPEQKKEQEHKVVNLVLSMEPLLNQVKQELKAAQSQLQSSSTTLYEKLSFFSNQIVKLKSDFSVQSGENRKLLQGFNTRLTQNRQTCYQVSLALSKLTQISLVSYILSLDPAFLQRQHEVYVTYNDGILTQLTENGIFSYRRKEFAPQVLKRAVLVEFIKYIDDSIVNKPLLNWNKAQLKPSHLYDSICHSYQRILTQNNIKIQQKRKPKQRNYPIQRKSVDPKLKSFRKQTINTPKIVSNEEIFSKTINQDRDLKLLNNTRYDIGSQERGQYTSRRKNVKLKKIDKLQM